MVDWNEEVRIRNRFCNPNAVENPKHTDAIRHVVPKDTLSFAVVSFASSPNMGKTNVGRIKTLHKLRRS